jgi:hypothetical protein
MATTKALELAQFGRDLAVDETTSIATYSGTFEAVVGYENLPTAFTIFGRSSNTTVPVSNGILTIVGRTSNVSIGIS